MGDLLSEKSWRSVEDCVLVACSCIECFVVRIRGIYIKLYDMYWTKLFTFTRESIQNSNILIEIIRCGDTRHMRGGSTAPVANTCDRGDRS